MTGSPMWEALKAIAAGRLRNRAIFWRKKAKEDLNVHPETALHRADECDACADVIETLNEAYVAPEEPELLSERRKRAANK